MPQLMFSHDNFYTTAFNKLNEVIEIVNSLSGSSFVSSYGYPVNEEINDTFVPYLNGIRTSGITFSTETYHNGATSSIVATISELTGSSTGAYKITFTPTLTGFWFVNMVSASAINQAYYYVSSLTSYSGGGSGNTAELSGNSGQVGVFSGTSSVTGYSSFIFDNGSITANKMFSTVTAHTVGNELITKSYTDTLSSEMISIYMDSLRLTWINM